jgi:DNA-binding NtrC family response regulator
MNRFKLLIVDDPKNIKNIEGCLHNQSFSVMSACSGQDAIKILRSTDIDILISKLELLDINGLAMYKAMKDQKPDMHCILIADSSCKMNSQDYQRLKIIDRPSDVKTISDCVGHVISQIKQNQRSKLKILVVEDTKALLFTQVKMLNKLGFSNIETASNGNQAIKCLTEMTCPPGLIISDWYMPEKTGLELLQWLQQHDSFNQIPFIMATSKKEAMMAIDAGANHFLIKPYDMDTIQKVIEKVLDI